MIKDDVELYDDLPSVNVKVYGSLYSVTLPLDLGSVSSDGGKTFEKITTDPGFNWDWLKTHESELEWTSDAALESGREDIASVAADIFGKVEVYYEGRSGGHAVVHGLPDIDSWDAIMLGKWSRFEKQVRAIVKDAPRAMLDLAYANVYEPWRDSRPEAILVTPHESLQEDDEL